MAIINKWRIRCLTDNTYEYVWLPDGDPAPTTCPTNTAHSVNAPSAAIVETTGEASTYRTDSAGDTCLVVTPGVMGGTFTPASPAIIDNFAGTVRGLTIDHVGTCWLEFSISANADNPAGPGDYSNIEWVTLDAVFKMRGEGRKPVPRGFITMLQQGRYIKIEPIRGDLVPKIHRFAS